jgi:hypothetical protein
MRNTVMPSLGDVNHSPKLAACLSCQAVHMWGDSRQR